MVFLAAFAQVKKKDKTEQCSRQKNKEQNQKTHVGSISQLQYGESPIDRLGQTYGFYTLKVFRERVFLFRSI